MNGYKNNYHLERRFHEFADLRELLRESSEKYSDKIAFIMISVILMDSRL